MNSIIRVGKRYIWLVIFYIDFLLNNHRLLFSRLPKLLIFNHNFDQDVFWLKHANEKDNSLALLTVKHSYLVAIYRSFIPLNKNEWNDFVNGFFETEKADFSNFFKIFICPIFNIFKIELFVSPSDIFPYMRLIIPILSDLKIKTIVIDKEGTISPYFFDYYANEIKTKYPLISQKILVWSERQKLFWKKTGIEESKIEVVGQPRSDFWFNKKVWKNKNQIHKKIRNYSDYILFFSFSTSAYIAPDLYASGEVSWEKLFEESHRGIIEFAKKNPNMLIVVKSHPQQVFENKSIEDEFNSTSNILHLKGAKISNDLIVNAKVVIGFLTTALIESMICNKPIVYLFWSDAIKWSENIIPFHKSGALDIAYSKEQMISLIERLLQDSRISTKMDSNRKKFIEEFLFGCDGNSSRRTLNFLNEIATKREC